MGSRIFTFTVVPLQNISLAELYSLSLQGAPSLLFLAVDQTLPTGRRAGCTRPRKYFLTAFVFVFY